MEKYKKIEKIPVKLLPLKTSNEEKPLLAAPSPGLKDDSLAFYQPTNPPIPKLPIKKMHSSCGDIFRLENSTHVITENPLTSSLRNFIEIQTDYPPQKPPLALPRLPPSLNSLMQSRIPPVNHPYEEVKDDFLMRSKKIINTSGDTDYPSPMQGQPRTLVLNSERTKLNANRSSAPYSTVKRSYVVNNSNVSIPSNSSIVISRRCFLLLTTALISTILISLISTTIALMYSVGIISNPSTISDEKIKLIASELKKNITSSVNSKLKIQNETLKNYNIRIDQLTDLIREMAQSNDEIQVGQIASALQSLSQDQLIDLFSNVSGSSLSRCFTDSYAIGISSFQDLGYSGEFRANEGFIVTGVTCSNPMGFISSLQIRYDVSSGKERVFYQCKCVRLSAKSVPTDEAPECGIVYWQCPISVV